MTQNGKASLFNRWKHQTAYDQLFEGISEEEKLEYKEAFRLFDKVSNLRLYLRLFFKKIKNAKAHILPDKY